MLPPQRIEGRALKRMRGGKGLGDALYVQAAARYLVQRGACLTVCTSWPDVFRPLGDAVQTVPFTRAGIDYLAHYTLRKRFPETTQFQDVCIQAGLPPTVELWLDWKPAESDLVKQLRDQGKPVVLVQLPRNPMDRKDGFGRELLPDCTVIQRVIDALRGRAYLVQVGAGTPLYRFKGIDMNLANGTTVSELLDVAAVADRVLGYCSFAVPLAESLDKPALFVWSQRGLRSGQDFIKRITPAKVLHKPSSKWILDKSKDDMLERAADELLRAQ